MGEQQYAGVRKTYFDDLGVWSSMGAALDAEACATSENIIRVDGGMSILIEILQICDWCDCYWICVCDLLFSCFTGTADSAEQRLRTVVLS